MAEKGIVTCEEVDLMEERADLPPLPGKNSRLCLQRKDGFTLIELLMIVVIIGVLSTLAISYFLGLKERANKDAIISDLTNAYRAAVIYHTNDANGELTVDILKATGYSQTDRVTLTVVDGTMSGLILTATHPGVHGVYKIDHTGVISQL